MIITRTPYRISYFGGGSDYETYYKKYGGMVLTSTIDKYCHVLLRKMPPFLGAKYLVFWSKAEKVNSREEIQHNGVRGCLQYMDIDDYIEVNHAGDLPARSGLGSSSSFTVGMLHALHVLNGNYPGRATLADQAIAVEQRILKETVGIQDQIECAWGGLNVIKITQDGEYNVTPILLSDEMREWVESNLVLVFTDLQRYATEIASAQVAEDNDEKIHKIVNLVWPAVEAMKSGDMEEFGRLLHESWLLKRGLSSKVTNSTIDDIYQKARQAGAYGGKILGAGGGGFMLLCVPPEKRQKVIDATGCLSVPVKFEFGGSQLVLNS